MQVPANDEKTSFKWERRLQQASFSS
jgi:hypothetical protein